MVVQLPMEKFFAVTADATEATNPLGNNRWAKQSYAFVHLCLYGQNGRYKAAFEEFTKRLAFPQSALANASGSQTNRWMLWAVGPVTYVSLDPDAWIYPLCYNLLDAQYAWLQQATLDVAPQEGELVLFPAFLPHKAMPYSGETEDTRESGQDASLPKERYIWGATAGMLRNLYRFLAA